MSRRVLTVAAACAMLALTGCQAPNQAQQVVLSTKSAVQLRAMQSRAFDSTDQKKTLRTIIATLQDLGYTIDKVELQAGTVSATKLSVLRLTATVFPRGSTQLTVRANAVVIVATKDTQVDDPEFYQKLFFAPLAKAMFLTALQIEDKDDAPQPGKEKSAEGGASGNQPKN